MAAFISGATITHVRDAFSLQTTFTWGVDELMDGRVTLFISGVGAGAQTDANFTLTPTVTMTTIPATTYTALLASSTERGGDAECNGFCNVPEFTTPEYLPYVTDVSYPPSFTWPNFSQDFQYVKNGNSNPAATTTGVFYYGDSAGSIDSSGNATGYQYSGVATNTGPNTFNSTFDTSMFEENVTIYYSFAVVDASGSYISPAGAYSIANGPQPAPVPEEERQEVASSDYPGLAGIYQFSRVAVFDNAISDSISSTYDGADVSLANNEIESGTDGTASGGVVVIEGGTDVFLTNEQSPDPVVINNAGARFNR